MRLLLVPWLLLASGLPAEAGQCRDVYGRLVEYYASQRPRHVIPHVLKTVFPIQSMLVAGAAQAYRAKRWSRTGILSTSAEILGRHLPHLLLNKLLPHLGVFGFVSFGVDPPIVYPRNDAEEDVARRLREKSPLEPDLYLDGEALADDVASRVAGRFAVDRLRDHAWGATEGALFFGRSFSRKESPNREALEKWILEQPMSSVTPAAMYEKAIEISEGSVERGLMLVWDHLTAEGPKRNLSEVAQRLVDVTGERAILLEQQTAERQSKMPSPFVGAMFGSGVVRNFPTGKTIRGDNVSAWYHFAGTALHSYMYSRTLGSSTAGGAYTRTLIALEEDIVFREFVDGRKRREIDLAGSRFGARLADRVTTDAPAPAPRPYLYPNAKVYGPSWHLRPGQSPWAYGSESTQVP